MSQLNRSVQRVGRGRILMTCFAAVIDTDRCIVTYVNAGHEAPLLMHHEGDGKIEIDALYEGTGRRLGESVDLSFPEVH